MYTIQCITRFGDEALYITLHYNHMAQQIFGRRRRRLRMTIHVEEQANCI